MTDQEFETAINNALASLPAEHMDALKNVAILYKDEPTPEQRQQNGLRHGETLLGLYEGVPLSHRNGMQPIYPDRITIFKLPIIQTAGPSREAIQQEIRHTLWHEIAHYFGLNHTQIADLE